MNNLKDKKYWLFDMDGTLTNAVHDFDAIRVQLDIPAGVPILEALAAMDPDEAAIKHQQLDDMELIIAADATPQPGSEELLTYLQGLGVKLGIVTRNGRDIADVTLKACGLDRFFEPLAIVSRDCCVAKPDPAGIDLLLSRWKGDAFYAVMVGDYLFDLQAGHSAGTTTIHLDVTSQFAWPEITDVSVSSLEQLHQQLL